MSSFSGVLLYKHGIFLVVHGFRQSVYDVEEGNQLDTEFVLNVVGTTEFQTRVVSGTITAEANGTTSQLHISMTSCIGSSLHIMCTSLYRQL